MIGKLVLQDGSEFEAISFGAPRSTAGELVFSTGMVGYPESFTDPSYQGQILILTYPLIGNYGVPSKEYWESDSIKISGLIVSSCIDTPSHFQSKMTLAQWLKKSNVPALEIADTRLLAQKLRDKGTCLGKIVIDKDVDWYDPNKENVVAKVSTRKILEELPPASPRLTGRGKTIKTVILIDCGAKRNIRRSLLKRGVRVISVPWDFNPFSNSRYVNVTQTRFETVRHTRIEKKSQPKFEFNGLVISNGPGNPKMATKTIETVQEALDKKIPTLGICLGHQLLALAAGGDTYKLKFGHRSQNQPALLVGNNRCYITTQNHGFAVGKIPKGFREWFKNANDGSNEGLIHEKLPFMSVQFHPEATPGPMDTEWIFDYFLQKIKD